MEQIVKKSIVQNQGEIELTDYFYLTSDNVYDVDNFAKPLITSQKYF